MNTLRTGLLMAAMMGLFLAAGYLLGREQGMLIAFVIAAGMNLFAYWNADKMVLRMHGARQVDRQSAPEFYGLVEELARNAGLPMPKVYIMDNPQPNAFATGRNPANSAVCASTGLLNSLSREEVAGVMAHELAHIKNRDTLTMTMAASIGGAITMLANMAQFGAIFGRRDNNGGGAGFLGLLFAIFLAPLAAMIVQMAISRSREYQADRMGAEICGNPHWLASALAKISQGARQILNEPAERSPAAAHVFIVNPLSGRGVDNLFSTHPNVENRIAELEKLAAEMGFGQTGGPPRSWSGGEVQGGPRGPWG